MAALTALTPVVFGNMVVHAGSLQATPSLKRSLAELYFREWCDQHGRAFFGIKDDGIAIAAAQGKGGHSNNNNSGSGSAATVAFRKGLRTVNVRLPEKTAGEVRDVVTATFAKSQIPPFDFLACKVGNRDRYDDPVVASPLGLCWVVIGSPLSEAQADALEKASLDVAVFRVRDVLASPREIEIKLDSRPAREWLDALDEQRDQAESDDDYL